MVVIKVGIFNYQTNFIVFWQDKANIYNSKKITINREYTNLKWKPSPTQRKETCKAIRLPKSWRNSYNYKVSSKRKTSPKYKSNTKGISHMFLVKQWHTIHNLMESASSHNKQFLLLSHVPQWWPLTFCASLTFLQDQPRSKASHSSSTSHQG